eukprot:COSAG01_NODE_713_length_14097_cov_15.136448_14_plen_111_part_00
MENAIKNLKIKTDLYMVDGNKSPKIKGYNIKAVIKGDQKHKEIAAASIIAKVTRDNIMKVYHQLYPHYNFKNNKGYGSKEHYEKLEKYGPSKIHRLSFNLKKKKKDAKPI